jgi:hypothetical protein
MSMITGTLRDRVRGSFYDLTAPPGTYRAQRHTTAKWISFFRHPSAGVRGQTSLQRGSAELLGSRPYIRRHADDDAPRALCMNEQSRCTRTLIVKKIVVPAPLYELRNKWSVDACNKAGVIDEFHAASGTNCVFAPSLKMT